MNQYAANISVPLVINGEVLGIFGFDEIKRKRNWADEFEDIIDILMSIGAMLAGMLQNSRLINKLQSTIQKREKDNKLLHEFIDLFSIGLKEPQRTISLYAQMLEGRFKDLINQRGKKPRVCFLMTLSELLTFFLFLRDLSSISL